MRGNAQPHALIVCSDSEQVDGNCGLPAIMLADLKSHGAMLRACEQFPI